MGRPGVIDDLANRPGISSFTYVSVCAAYNIRYDLLRFNVFIYLFIHIFISTN